MNNIPKDLLKLDPPTDRQITNVSVDVNIMERSFQRSLDDDYVSNANLKRSIINKLTYLTGFVNESTVSG